MANWYTKTLGDTSFSLTMTDEDAARSYVEAYKQELLKEGGEIYAETLTFTIQPQISFTVMDQTNGHVKVMVGTASMNTYDVALRVGKTKQLVCNGTTGKMVWKSSNPKVATVDKKGLVKAIKPGKAMISVSGGNLIGSMTCKVGVSKKITTKQARRKIMAMKKTYKEGLSWTNENRQYFWEATNCQCYGCIALCGEISDKVFGKYAPVTKHSNFSRIKAGDHIRIGNEHSVMVLQKNGNTLTVVEGNYNATVHWGRKITKKELQESGFYVETRY